MSELPERPYQSTLRLARRIAGAASAALYLPSGDETEARWWSDPASGDALQCWLEEITRAVPEGPWAVADAAGVDPHLRTLSEEAGIAAWAVVPVPGRPAPAGRLFVSDTRARDWTAEQLDDLAEVAASMAAEHRLRRRVEERGAAADEYHDLLERASEMIVSVEIGGRVLFVNEAMRRALGYEAEELLDRQATDFVAPEFHETYREAAERIVREGVIRGIEVELLVRDGSRITVAGSGNCRYVDGEAVATRLFLHDITVEKQVEKDLSLLHATTRAIGAGRSLADGLPEGMALLAGRGGWVRAEAWLALEPDQRATRVASWPDPPAEDAADTTIPELVRRAIRNQHPARSQDGTIIALPIAATDAAPGVLLFEHPSVEVPEDEISFLKAAVGHLAPIIERRRAKAALVYSRAQLAEFLDSVSDLVVTVGPTGLIRYANRAWRETMGFLEADLSKLRIHEVLPPEMRATAVNDMQRALHTMGATRVETGLVARDGQTVQVEGVIRPHLQRDGARAMVGIFTDVTRRAEAERELHKTEERLRSILQTVQEGILVVDASGNPLFGNPAASRILHFKPGLSPDTPYQTPDWRIQGRPPGEFLHGDPAMSVILSTGEPVFGVERTLEHRDGTRSIISFNGAPLLDETEQIAGVVLSFQDVTVQKQFVQQLRERGRQLADAQMIGGIGSWEWDLVTEEITWSDYLYRIFGFPAGTPVTIETFLHFVVPGDRQRVQGQLQKALARREPFAFEYQILTTSGELRTLYTRGDVVRDPHDQPIRVAGIAQDVTQRRQQDEALRQARDAAQAAARAKSQFLANMSHEIRTPLTGILGMTDLLLASPSTPEQRKYLEMVRSSGASLLQIIDDILDVSRMEAGKLTLDAQPFSLRESVTHVAQQLGVQAADKGLNLALRIAPDVPHWIHADEGRLRQILVNLIGNAIKFTQEGEVVVEVEIEPDESAPEGESLHLRVRDTGIGIPEAVQAQIFDPFTQADGSTTRRFGGTGLGLSITAQLVRLMEGRTWVESEEGVGSVFHVVVPLVRAAEDSAAPAQFAPPAAVERFSRLRVLIADESATTREILREMLLDWSITQVEMAEEIGGLDRFLAGNGAGRSVDVYIIGCSLDGAECERVVERIRAAGGAIVVLTESIADRAAAARASELAVRHLLPQPIDCAQLFDILKQIVSAPEMEAVPLPSILPAENVGADAWHILLAEDNVVNQRYVEALLTRAGHTVEIVGDGKAAVERGLSGEFDLVLMDLQMPELSGLEATEQIRAAEAETGRHLPIIALTAHALQGDRERCLAAGMDDYLSKPFSGPQLLDKLAEVARAAAVGEAGPRGRLSAATDAFVGLLGSEETLQAVGSAFLDHAGPALDELQAAVEQRDVAAARHAHTLKGSTSILGADEAVAALRQIEEAVRQERWTEAEQQVATLAPLMAELQAALRQSLAEVGG